KMHGILAMVESVPFQLPDAMLGADAAAILHDFLEDGISDSAFPFSCPALVGPDRARHVVMKVSVAKVAEDEQAAILGHFADVAFGRIEECRNTLDRERNIVLEMGAVGSLGLRNFFAQPP